jgi:hypothetical protein
MADSKKLKFIRADKAVAFDPVEFGLSLHFILETSRKIQWDMVADEEKAAEASFVVAAADRYQKDTIKAVSFVYRWGALMRLIDRGGIDESLFRRAHNPTGFDWIHDSVVQVAATLKPTKTGEFARRAFLAELKRKILQAGSTP